jgi:outer membrane protein OmpA-like peptidoglycan-associated protein
MIRVRLTSLCILASVTGSLSAFAQGDPPVPPPEPPAPSAPPPSAAAPAPAATDAPASPPAATGAAASGSVSLGTEGASATASTAASDAGDDAEDENPNQEREARLAALREQATVSGSTGLLRLQQPSAGVPGTFRFSVYTSYFGSSGFLCNADSPCPSVDGAPRTAEDGVDRIGMHLGLSATLFPFLEAYFGLHNSATSNTRSRPRLLQVLGDTNFGLKGFLPVEVDQIFQVGGELELKFLNGTGGVGIDGGGTSFAIRALSSLALDNKKNPDEAIPLRLHANLGYLVDNSGKLVEEVENTPPPAGRGESILRTERFGLDVNRVDSFEIGLGAQYVHPMVRPFIEWTMDVPVNRQDYVCDENVAEEHGELCLAKAQQFSTSPSRLTIGARLFPWQERGLALLGAIDIGTGATSDFIDEIAPEPPYTLWMQLAWAVDTEPPKPIIQRVEKDVQAVVVSPARYVLGTVVDKATSNPVPAATVFLDGRPGSGFVSAEDGTFKTYTLDPGNYTFNVKAEGFRDGQCAATVPPDSGAPTANAEVAKKGVPVTMRCELEALPKVGTVVGSLVDSETQAPVGNASVKIRDKLNRELTLTADASGSFRFQNVPPGTIWIIVDAPGYFTSTNEFAIKPLKDTNARVQLNRRPTQPNVIVAGAELKLKKQVHFQTDSAEILPDSMAILEEIADVLKARPDITSIEVQGHTDNQGEAAHNLELSQNRAQAVVGMLIKLGVDAGRLQAQGYGDKKPLMPNVSEANRARNRRVQLMIKK